MRTLYGQRWFKPMDIAKQGLIQNSKGDAGTVSGNYDFVLELIAAGRLKAKNYGKGSRPYWMVPESEIVRYHDTVSRVVS